jgi:hypothetical protein
MRMRRKPKVVPRVVIRAEWSYRDPVADEREAQVLVRAWAAAWAALVPALPRRGVES